MIERGRDLPARAPVSQRARVVVIGTGAGGAVATKELAEAGLDVLALEAGSTFSAEDVDQREETTFPRLYAEGGMRGTRDKSLLVLQGRGVGGSTLHNTGLCFRAPPGVLDRWRREHGLALDGFDRDLETVERHLGVRPVREDEVNPANAMLAKGARALGWRHVRANHNRVDCEGCGYCVLGCAYDKKQGMSLTYVPRALAAGARILADARVERLSRRGGLWRARGHVVGPDRKPRAPLEVEAEAVVLAAGAIDTPALLLRSGIARGTAGASLRLHPSLPVAGIFPEKLRAFRGIPQSILVTEHASFLETGHGGWVAIPAFGQPAATALMAPSLGREHWEVVRRYEHMSVAAVLLHDETRGRVRPGWLGVDRPRIDYWPEPAEQRALVAGVRDLARVFLAAGAEAVVLPFAGAPLARNEGDLAGLERYPFAPHLVSISSVHPQGSCPMGEGPLSVADVRGQVREAPGLWLADASAFPTSLGLPPQITTAALAARTARFAAGSLRPR